MPLPERIICDPVTRIEGHLGADIALAGPIDPALSTLFPGSVGAGTKVFSTMYRGFENILKGRDPRDAIQITQRICGVCPVPHGITSTFAVENAMGYSTAAGDNTGYSSGPSNVSRLIRNLTLGGEFMMSAITHFYALTALDLVQGPAMAPWLPFWDDSYYDPALLNGNDASGNPANVNLTFTGGLPDTIYSAVIADYVLALRTRTKALDIGAIFGGRLPIASAFTAGGVTKLPIVADIDAASGLLADVTSFIETHYVPMTEIVSVLHGLADNTNNGWAAPLISLGLQATGGTNNRGPYSCIDLVLNEGTTGEIDLTHGIGLGKGCGNFYAAGGFDQAGNLTGGTDRLFPRGVVKGASDSASGDLEAVDPMKIKESIVSSRYAQGTTTDPDAWAYLQPLEGVTMPVPDRDGAYTWHKAPRYDDTVVEVGPLARMWVKGVTEGLDSDGYCAGMTKYMSSHAWGIGGGALNPLPDFGPGGVAAAALGFGGTGVPYNCGISVMDRHRARAREAALVAANMRAWLTELKAIVSVDGWELDSDNARYTQPAHALETLTAEGIGMAEAPRGAVHHWIKVKNGKIDNYQLQAPTTWNCSGRDGFGHPGPVEQALIGWPVRAVASPDTPEGKLVPVEALIIIHSFDPCIACSVHVIEPEDKDATKELSVGKGGVE